MIFSFEPFEYQNKNLHPLRASITPSSQVEVARAKVNSNWLA
jgi:hypothetical protein